MDKYLTNIDKITNKFLINSLNVYDLKHLLTIDNIDIEKMKES